MTSQQFLKVHNARPFRPYTICLADGQRLRVRHPEFAAVLPVARAAVVAHLDGTVSIIDLPLVASLEVARRARR